MTKRKIILNLTKREAFDLASIIAHGIEHIEFLILYKEPVKLWQVEQQIKRIKFASKMISILEEIESREMIYERLFSMALRERLKKADLEIDLDEELKEPK